MEAIAENLAYREKREQAGSGENEARVVVARGSDCDKFEVLTRGLKLNNRGPALWFLLSPFSELLLGLGDVTLVSLVRFPRENLLRWRVASTAAAFWNVALPSDHLVPPHLTIDRFLTRSPFLFTVFPIYSYTRA